MDFQDEASKVSGKRVAALENVVEKLRSRLDPAGAAIAELKNCQGEADASTALCCKELLQGKKYVATALEKVGKSPTHAFSMMKKRDAMTTKY